MSVDAIYSKRERRQFEPEEKTWNDEALKLPWEDIQPPLNAITIFSLKNIFFFSHATAIQALVLENLSENGNSAVVEAPTGSGKTLAFLIPLMERTVRLAERIVQETGRPPLTRRLLGVILSPSRALAEQTFVVGKRLAARFPFNIQFALCDGVVETAAAAYEHLKKCSRGVGSYLVTTPEDLLSFLTLLKSEEDAVSEDIREILKEQDEETKKRYLAKRKRQMKSVNKDENVQFYSSAFYRFLVIVDEADLILQYSNMREILHNFVDTYLTQPSTDRKRSREEVDGVKVEMDFFFVGATVSVSPHLKHFTEEVCDKAHSRIHFLHVKEKEDVLSQLTNRYAVCDSSIFLTLLVQLINIHAGKKHFVFFNSSNTLKFVKALFSRLAEGPRPILFVNSIFTMYEGMTENARIQQYNSFLTHNAATSRQKQKPKPLSDAEKRNQFFTSGWKRSGTPQKGHGAVLLCTDVAAFGLDVRDVDYVYHFEPPSSVKTYIHRIGRVGRMGMKGTSVLLCPASVQGASEATVRERKTTSNRFNTVTNTKTSTGHLQKVEASVSDLPEKQRKYMKQLSKKISLTEYMFPSFAPISSTLRNIIVEDPQVLKLAKKAAMTMCEPEQNEECWFTPRLAIECLLLNT